MSSTMDDFLLHLGDPGMYQMISFTFLAFNILPVGFNHFLMAYYDVTPKHSCRLPNIDAENYTSGLCHLNSSSNNIISECLYGYEYANTDELHSIVQEWDLVCDKKPLTKISTTLYFIGVVIGAPISGILADKIGRKKVLLGSIYSLTLIGIAVAFVKNFWVFTLMRCAQGIFAQATANISFNLIMEIFAPKWRTMGAMMSSFAWPITQIILAGLASSVKSWRTMQLAISLPFLYTVVFIWIMPESMRWLLLKNKVNKSMKFVRCCKKFNKLEISEENAKLKLTEISKDLMLHQEKVAEIAQNYGLIDLVRTPKMRQYTIVLAIMGFSFASSFYGVTYYLSRLPINDNVYVIFVISGVIDIITRFLLYFLLSRFGRKFPSTFSFLGGGVCVLLLAFNQNFIVGEHPKMATLSVVFALLGKTLLAWSSNCILLQVTELYPTVIRSTGLGVSSFLSRLGMVLSPIIMLLEDVWPPLPMMILAALSITSGMLSTLLPETLEKPLPDTIEDVEN